MDYALVVCVDLTVTSTPACSDWLTSTVVALSARAHRGGIVRTQKLNPPLLENPELSKVSTF